ncbi:hypothetical protein GWK87_11190 [Staphylococcus schleiferi subsp. coagulans]|nr:hypothetical protein [Staphylococcus coagulans]MBA8769484.1 hypothetical protein [Staphylococcus coagulans]
MRKDYKKALDIVRNERDTLINDITKLRKERDELIVSNHKAIQGYAKLKRKLEDVVKLLNAHNYDKLQNELNRILEDE